MALWRCSTVRRCTIDSYFTQTANCCYCSWWWWWWWRNLLMRQWRCYQRQSDQSDSGVAAPATSRVFTSHIILAVDGKQHINSHYLPDCKPNLRPHTCSTNANKKLLYSLCSIKYVFNNFNDVNSLQWKNWHSTIDKYYFLLFLCSLKQIVLAYCVIINNNNRDVCSARRPGPLTYSRLVYLFIFVFNPWDLYYQGWKRI